MSVCQVEEYYIYINNKSHDFYEVKKVCDEHGVDFIQDGETAVVETFYSNGDAEEFESILESLAGI